MRVITTKTSARRICSECAKLTDWLLQVGEIPDYESQTAYLCRDCLRRAAGILADHARESGGEKCTIM